MELREAVVNIIAEALRLPVERIRDESKLIELARDSIALFELLIRFEAALGRQVTYADIAHVETVGDIVAYAYTLPVDVIAPMLAAVKGRGGMTA